MKFLILLISLFLSVNTSIADDIQTGMLSGVILDQETGEPVPYVYMHIEEIKRFATSSRDGEFLFTNMPPGEFTLSMHRLGYINRTITVYLEPDQETKITIQIRQTTLSGDEVEVRADRDVTRGANLQRSSLKVSGDALRENMGVTLSETLLFKPGFDQRSMGAAPARPVVRGLGDQRIVILQDGMQTGDVSYTSADHAVTIDPLGADEIEVLRGPFALMYGANAIGGVINVVRNQIPTNIPTQPTGIATLGASSVNTGFSGALTVTFPWRDYAINFETNTRYGDDFRAPGGRIDNSNYFSTQNSIGLWRDLSWGNTGFAISSYVSNYGIPPDPVQGHVSGVDIEMIKFGIENRTEINLSESFLRILEVSTSYRFYNHKEFETATVIGTEYTTNNVKLGLISNHRPWFIFQRGVIGLSANYQYYFLADRETTETNLWNAGVFGVQRYQQGPWDLELGLRFDLDHIAPFESFVHPRIGNIRERTFLALSGSVGFSYDLGRGFYTGGTFLHSYRPPTADELHSRGPHIAAYSFEIGNPDLDSERGLASELFFRYRGNRLNFDITGYHTYFTNYIYPRDTGLPSPPFPRLNIWQFESTTARMYGIETGVNLRLTQNLSLESAISHTIAEREPNPDFDVSTSWQALPMIPPLTVSGGIHYQFNDMRFGTRVRHAERQDRTAEFENPTSGYTILDLHFQYRYTSPNRYLHTITLRVENALDEEYRSHLSRLKEVFPEPGRNFELLYRVFF